MVMPSPLLETKLYIPRLRRGLVTRPRLSERLSRGCESKLTLVSAPAGFGKTTLVAEWLAAETRVSFDSPLRLRRSLSLRRVTRPRRTLGMKSLASSSGLGMTI